MFQLPIGMIILKIKILMFIAQLQKKKKAKLKEMILISLVIQTLLSL